MRIEAVRGDITRERVDAIVNAANEALAGGGGVDGAIHRAAGADELHAACAELGGCATGDAKATTAGELAARYVIHAVGPVWRGGDAGEPELLASAHRRSLEVASELTCTSVAFPAISCGVYGYPPELAATIAIGTTRETLARLPEIQLVRFVLFSDEVYAAYGRALSERRSSARNSGSSA